MRSYSFLSHSDLRLQRKEEGEVLDKEFWGGGEDAKSETGGRGKNGLE